jgi:hypothetical protein
VQPPDKQRWIEEARTLGYSDTPSDKVLVIDAEPEALTPFLPQPGTV